MTPSPRRTPTGCCSSRTAGWWTSWPTPRPSRFLTGSSSSAATERSNDPYRREERVGAQAATRRSLPGRLPRRLVPVRNARARRDAEAQLRRPVRRRQRRHRRRRAQRHQDRHRRGLPARPDQRDDRRRIRGVDGVASAVAYVEGYGQLLDKHGEGIGGNGPPRLAASWIGDPELNAYRLVDGRATRADD